MNSSSGRRRTQKCPVPGYRCKRRTRCNKTERRCSILSEPTRKFPRRCKNGSRRQKDEDGCVETTNSTKYERCKNGTRRHKRTKECDENVVHLFKNRKRILARGRHLSRMDKSANSPVKKHKRFTFAPDVPREPIVDNNETTNNYDMNEFDQGDYTNEGNGNAEVEETGQQLSPISEEEEEEEEKTSPPQFIRRKPPKIQNKTHNTRSSSQRTRSETARYKVNYGFNGSRKSRK